MDGESGEGGKSRGAETAGGNRSPLAQGVFARRLGTAPALRLRPPSPLCGRCRAALDRLIVFWVYAIDVTARTGKQTLVWKLQMHDMCRLAPSRHLGGRRTCRRVPTTVCVGITRVPNNPPK
eukprot:gene10731-biopygen4802